MSNIKKNIVTEILYFLTTSIVAFILLVMICKPGDSPDEFMFKIITSFVKMKIGRMFLFWGVVTIFTLTIVRQLKQKFKNIFTNMLLITTGLILVYKFHKFVWGVNKLKSYYAKDGDEAIAGSLHYDVILLRCLQIFILVIVVIAIINLIKISKTKRVY